MPRQYGTHNKADRRAYPLGYAFSQLAQTVVHMEAVPVANSHHLVTQWFDVPPLGKGTSILNRKHILGQWVSRNQPDISEAWQNNMYSLFEGVTANRR